MISNIFGGPVKAIGCSDQTLCKRSFNGHNLIFDKIYFAFLGWLHIEQSLYGMNGDLVFKELPKMTVLKVLQVSPIYWT